MHELPRSPRSPIPHERAERSAYSCSIQPQVAGVGGTRAGAATRVTSWPSRVCSRYQPGCRRRAVRRGPRPLAVLADQQRGTGKGGGRPVTRTAIVGANRPARSLSASFANSLRRSPSVRASTSSRREHTDHDVGVNVDRLASFISVEGCHPVSRSQPSQVVGYRFVLRHRSRLNAGTEG